MSNIEFCIMPPCADYGIERSHKYSHKHHIFGEANRKQSEKDGLVIFLTPEMHNGSDYGIHFNRDFDLSIKRLAEETWLKYYGRTIKDFIRIYGKNYL